MWTHVPDLLTQSLSVFYFDMIAVKFSNCHIITGWYPREISVKNALFKGNLGIAFLSSLLLVTRGYLCDTVIPCVEEGSI